MSQQPAKTWAINIDKSTGHTVIRHSCDSTPRTEVEVNRKAPTRRRPFNEKWVRTQKAPARP